MGKDYYSILGVDKNATSDEIKKAYRKLSKQHHPDVADNKDSDDVVFKDISEAYSILSNKDKKNSYDNKGKDFGFDDLFGGRGGFGGFDFGDIFGGRRSTQRQHRPGSDIKISVGLSLDEVETGTTKTIKYKRKESCGGCNGKGGSDEKNCMPCDGKGVRISVTRTPMGTIQQQVICTNCAGTGKIILNKCGTCNGSGDKEITEELTFDSPVGASDSVLYKYTGKGNSNKHGTGDLLVNFNITPHRYFIRQGKNLIYNIKLPFSILVSGGQINIKGLNGKVFDLTIPKMTKPGQILRIPRKGLSNIDNILDRGDIILNVDVEFPTEINDIELELISQLNNKPNFIYKQK
tara:strand:+ start:50398 stop:51444 length:1047 start_codon:yes stop_codon:yes gene_type:complete